MIRANEIHLQLEKYAATQSPECHLYGLLDSSIYASEQLPQLGGRISSLARELYLTDYLELFAYAFDEQGNEASPLLVPMKRLDSDLAKNIAFYASFYPMCSWLWSPLPGEKLAKHLSSFIRAEIGGCAAILRPYDPRLTEEVIACFNEARKSQMLSGIAQWVYCDDREHLKIIEGTQLEFSGVEASGPIQLTAEEQANFEHLANRTALESYIGEHAAMTFDGLSATDRKNFCNEQLAIGEHLGSDSMGDLLMIAILSQRYGCAWIDEQAIGPFLNVVTSKLRPLRDVMRDIDTALAGVTKKS